MPAALMLVFTLAKAIALAGRPVEWAPWSPVAYLWQDAAVVLVFTLLPRARRTLYSAAAILAIVNIPVTRAMGTPLTPTMLHAAGGPLADSFRRYATWQNVALILTLAVITVIAPRALRCVPIVPFLAILAALGPIASRHVDTFGFERNPLTALLALRQSSSNGDWSTITAGPSPRNLAHLRGAAAGFNIIYISLESTAAQYLGLHGAQPDPMPNLSRLAGNAVVFDNAYAAYPESIKGLHSILCSTWPAFASDTESYASLPCRSFASVLADAGHCTALFHSGRFVYLGMEAVIRNRGFTTLEDAGDIGGNHQSSFGIDEPSTVARALRWIDSLPPDRPFFLTYLPIAGHHPYDSPAGGPFPDTDDFGRYRNALYYGDASLGALIEGIRARGLQQRTLWIIAGDHGEAFGQHPGNYGHTFHLYEENIHVPLVIAAPGLIARQIREPQVVSLIDLAPTVLALAGLAAPAEYQGRSLLDAPPHMALFFADYSLGLLGLRDGGSKCIYEPGSGRARLFDLRTDPFERRNLATQFPTGVRSYTQNLEHWSAHVARAFSLPCPDSSGHSSRCATRTRR
jgi:hypothetical protein